MLHTYKGNSLDLFILKKVIRDATKLLLEGSKASLRQSLKPLPLCVVMPGELGFDDLQPVTQAHPHQRPDYPQHQKAGRLPGSPLIIILT